MGSGIPAESPRDLDKHRYLFRAELGLFNDGVEMPICFHDDKDVKGLKQPCFPLSLRDRAAMNDVLDPLLHQGRLEKVPLSKPSPVSSPAFVVWSKAKPRVVIDLRRVNERLIPNAYPLPRQDEVLGAIGGAIIFSSLDVTKGFFQQPIRTEDRWKTAFSTPHRGHEQLTVASIGLSSSPGFFQARMERILARYLWQFVCVYIDDVIIFSRNQDEHLRHLDEVLTLLEDAGISLSLKKCHFAYRSVKMLGHHVSRLGVSTAEDKVAAVANMRFPRTLRSLEAGVQFFSYYRRFVERFAAIADPLNRLKTLLFRPGPTKGRKRQNFATRVLLEESIDDTEWNKLLHEAKQAWADIKHRLTHAPTLAYPDFKREFLMYVDGSYEWGFGVAVHQVGDDGVERPVLFLSKALTAAEKNYGATELECAALIWMLTKLPQYTDSGFKVITDHAALINALQGKSAGRSARLNRWALYLAGTAGSSRGATEGSELCVCTGPSPVMEWAGSEMCDSVGSPPAPAAWVWA